METSLSREGGREGTGPSTPPGSLNAVPSQVRSAALAGGGPPRVLPRRSLSCAQGTARQSPPRALSVSVGLGVPGGDRILPGAVGSPSPPLCPLNTRELSEWSWAHGQLCSTSTSPPTFLLWVELGRRHPRVYMEGGTTRPHGRVLPGQPRRAGALFQGDSEAPGRAVGGLGAFPWGHMFKRLHCL